VVTNLVLTVPLTWLVGYEGPALASVIAIIPAWIITLYRIGDSLRGGIGVALPWRFYGRVLALSIGLGALLAVGHRAVGLHPALAVPLALAVYAPVFLAAGYAVGVIKREDVHYLLRAVSLGVIK
jgi:hypothetical protein